MISMINIVVRLYKYDPFSVSLYSFIAVRCQEYTNICSENYDLMLDIGYVKISFVHHKKK
ncbi:MAG: hypothetical protein ACFFAV_12675 [Candidatus Hermodarchaeota archaeon]